MAFTRVIPKFLQGYAAAGLMDKPKWQTEGGSCFVLAMPPLRFSRFVCFPNANGVTQRRNFDLSIFRR